MKKNKQKENLHEGHRQRMLNRVRERGMDGLYPHEVLEVLLFRILPRVNTNPHGHRLINAFGSLKNVLEASPGELERVEGIGPASAAFIAETRPTVSQMILEQYTGANDLTLLDFAILTDWFMRDEKQPVGILLMEGDGTFLDFTSLPLVRNEMGELLLSSMFASLPYDLTNLEFCLFVRPAQAFSEDDIAAIRRYTFAKSFILQEIYVMQKRKPCPVLYPEREQPDASVNRY
ncbi:MAG: hypothetical protein IJC71_03920 [Clostridia bacterium]|nr:hypothetical protein [Clostridia bacterium]